MKKSSGDDLANIALEVYVYRIKKYIGAYLAVLESLDGLIFTAGTGENSPDVREFCCLGLSKYGMEIDPEKNRARERGIREINTAGNRVKILIIPTNEELKIVQETEKVIGWLNRS